MPNCLEEWASCTTCKLIVAPFITLGVGIFVAQNISGVCTGVLLWPIFAFSLLLLIMPILIYYLGKLSDEEQRYDMKICKRFVFWYIFVVLLALFVFVVIGYIAVGGSDISSNKVREYDLKDYSGWLKGRTADQQYWDRLSACLRRKHACKRMTTRQLVRDPGTGIFVPETSSEERRQARNNPDDPPPTITPIESGCCKPPSSCGFTYVNGTTWTPAPGAPAVETDVDCSRWSNDQQNLCFQCDSCKAGLLANIKKVWSVAGLVLLIDVLLTIICSFLILAKLARR
ncbi:hypothetical protein ACP70R_048441 [Stipagrostis hirtigluma subsp. patula]